MPVNHKSGLYSRLIRGFHFEARLDVDGNHPQNQVSVTLTNRLPSHWIAELRQLNSRTWEGAIWYRHKRADRLRIGGHRPNRIRVVWQVHRGRESVLLEFRRNSQRLARIRLDHQSAALRQVEFELDREDGVAADVTYNTHAHPLRPSNLADEDLSLHSIFERSGVGVTINDRNNAFSIGAGSNQRWNPAELHDAMQANWSRPDGTPWAMWVMFASLFENNPGRVVFGMMFDSIGSFHRNGTAMFMEEIERFYPPGTANRDATIDRHKFRTLVHEVGHGFNLLHSWQKELGTPWHQSVTNEPQARSFMNYPGRVAGGDKEYWRRFRFRFSDQELLFMRHAPEEFVAMGGASWTENHADSLQPDMLDTFDDNVTDSDFELSIRFNRPINVFEFMEPVLMEVKMKNTSGKTRDVAPEIVSDPALMEVFVTRNFGETKRLRPYVKFCYAPATLESLEHDASIYGSFLLSSATDGWLIDEPGRYDIVVSIRSSAMQDDRVVQFAVNAQTTLYVRPPDPTVRRDAQRFAQDYFTDDVGRLLAFQGSYSLVGARNTMEELADRFADSPAAQHARIVVDLPATRGFKELRFVRDEGVVRPVINVRPRNDSQLETLCRRLIEHGNELAATLSHIGFKQLTDVLSDRQVEANNLEMATQVQQNTLNVMRERGVNLPAAVMNGIGARIRNIRGG